MLRLSEAELNRLTRAGKPVRGSSEAQGAVSIDGAIRLTLPYPPSTNHLFASVNGRRVKTAAARAYADEAGMLARVVCANPVGGKLSVVALIRPPRYPGIDIDNLKVVFDSLTGIVWRDDRQIWRLSVERGPVIAGGCVELCIFDYREMT